MRLIFLTIVVLASAVRADSFFFSLPDKPDLSTAKIQGDHLHVTVNLERLPIPKAGGIEVVRDDEGQVLTRVYLTDEPARGWLPFIKLNEQIIQVSKVTRMGPQYASSFEINFPDWEEAVFTARTLAKLLKIPEERVAIEEKPAEQAGADQPATAPQLKSEGKEKPKPESKVRPQ